MSRDNIAREKQIRKGWIQETNIRDIKKTWLNSKKKQLGMAYSKKDKRWSKRLVA